MHLLNSDWPANILAGAHFQAQENGLMSPDGVCAISACPAGHETSMYCMWKGLTKRVFLPMTGSPIFSHEYKATWVYY